MFNYKGCEKKKNHCIFVKCKLCFMKHLKISILLTFFITNSFCQNISIMGRVVDKSTNESLSFANIRVGQSSYGCISNDEGFYKLTMPIYFKDSIIHVTYIGYLSFSDSVKNLIGKTTKIELQSSISELPEVNVLAPDPVDIITKAVLNMNENYWSNPIISDAFYREVLFENDKAKRLSEAACSYYLAPYRSQYLYSESTSQIFSGNDYLEFDTHGYLIDIPATRHPANRLKIKEVRTSNDMSATMTHFYITGGPMGAMCYDVLNHQYRWSFPAEKNYKKTYKSFEKNLRNATISYSEWNNRPIFIISSKSNYKEWTFYIDRKTNAIIKYDFLFRIENVSTIPAMNKQFVKRKVVKEKISTDSIKISVQYMLSNEKWYISSITAKSYFTYFPYNDNPLSLRTEREVMINDIKLKNVVPFEPDSCFSDNAFANMFNYPTGYNDEFWNNYNSLYPTSLQTKIKEDLEVYQPLSDQYSLKFKYSKDLKPPMAKKVEDTLFINNDTYPDNYRWLEFGLEDSIMNYVNMENEYCDNYFLKNAVMTRAFLEEIGVKYKVNSFLREKQSNTTVDWKYYFDKDFGESGAFVRKHLKSENVDVLIDMSKEAKNYPLFQLAGYGFNKDTSIFYYTSFPYGDEAYFDIQTVFVDLKTLYRIDTVYGVVGSWFSNKDFCYFVFSNEDYYIKQCFYKTIGENNSQKLFEAAADEVLMVQESNSGESTFLIVDNGGLSTQLYYIENSSPTIVNKVDELNERAYLSSVEQYKGDDSFYILSNENAPNFLLYKINPRLKEDSAKEIIIPEMSDKELVSAKLIDSLFVVETLDGINQDVEIFNPSSQLFSKVYISDDLHSSSVKEIKDGIVTIKYETYLNPTKYYEYTISDGSIRLIGGDSIANYNPEDFKVNLEYAESIDGKKIPIVLISYKYSKAKKSPLFLTTYGGGGSFYKPSFNAEILPLLVRGITVGYALIRGGGETGINDIIDSYGKNQILNAEDFAFCAKYLIKKKYTNSESLFAYGKSFGGMILAYSLVKYPSLFKAMILDVPACDLLTDLSDSTLNENKYDYHVLGSPYVNEEYQVLRKIDAYQNIVAQDYPNLLFFGAMKDINVKPSASIKMVAKLREHKTDDNLLLLRVSLKSGHLPAEGIMRQQTSMMYAFIFSCLED